MGYALDIVLAIIVRAASAYCRQLSCLEDMAVAQDVKLSASADRVWRLEQGCKSFFGGLGWSLIGGRFQLPNFENRRGVGTKTGFQNIKAWNRYRYRNLGVRL